MASIGFIGVGNMGGALADAAAKNCSTEILVNDAQSEKAQAVAERLSAKSVTAEEICKKADYIFVGVKPQIIGGVLNEMTGYLKGRHTSYTIVSMAAGVSTKQIRNHLGFDAPIIRIMPNLPVSVGKGMVLYSPNALVKTDDSEKLIELMSFSGVWDKIDEDLIDAASALSACGPAFIFMYIDALAKGGEQCGLPREKALKYATQTALGSAEMLKVPCADPGVLCDAVCSPGGSTIEGVKSLNGDNLEKTVITAVCKSFNRTKELGKQ